MNFTKEELDNEIWKDILGYDYKYQISNLGRLKRVTSFHKNKENEITLGSLDTYGYLRTSFTKNGKSIGKKLHRLVAEYFLKGYSENLTINHINFKKDDNRLCNLEIMSARDNIFDYIIKVKKENSYSKNLGVGYHKQIGKWTTRVNIDGKRKSLGTYDTKEEAEYAIKNYKDGDFKEGKGVSNIGIRKYSEEDLIKIKDSLLEIGFTKTRKLFNIGSSTLKLIKDNKYYEKRS